jgi:hypothetical protein
MVMEGDSRATGRSECAIAPGLAPLTVTSVLLEGPTEDGNLLAGDAAKGQTGSAKTGLATHVLKSVSTTFRANRSFWYSFWARQ